MVSMAVPERNVPQTFSDLKGLSEKWDADAKVHTRIREFGRLLVEEPAKGQAPVVPESAVAKTVSNLRFNSFVISPLLVKMNGKISSVPDIDALIREAQQIFKSHGRNPLLGDVKNDAWGLRYLFGILKGFQWKKVPPKVSWQNSSRTVEQLCWGQVGLRENRFVPGPGPSVLVD